MVYFNRLKKRRKKKKKKKKKLKRKMNVKMLSLKGSILKLFRVLLFMELLIKWPYQQVTLVMVYPLIILMKQK